MSEAAKPFTEHELDSMHADDRKAGRAIILLMLVIFIVGIVMYSFVAHSVASGW